MKHSLFIAFFLCLGSFASESQGIRHAVDSNLFALVYYFATSVANPRRCLLPCPRADKP